jgi:hypothetical protein
MRCRANTGLVVERPPPGTFQIIELAGPEGPEKCRETGAAERQGYRHEPSQSRHGIFSFSIPERRKAFSVTASEEADMAIAAISGVTMPAIAMGTNTAL